MSEHGKRRQRRRSRSLTARGTGPAGAEMVAVNVRCLDDIDLAALTPTPFDGRSL